MRIRRIAIVGVAVAGLLAAGCGDDSDAEADAPETTAGEPATTQAEFIAQADAVCLAADAEIDAIAAGVTPAATPEQASEVIVEAVNQVISIRRGELDALQALGAPEGDSEVIAGYLDAFGVAITNLEAAVATVETGGAPADTGLTFAANVFDAADSQARAYGMAVCGAAG